MVDWRKVASPWLYSLTRTEEGSWHVDCGTDSTGGSKANLAQQNRGSSTGLRRKRIVKEGDRYSPLVAFFVWILFGVWVWGFFWVGEGCLFGWFGFNCFLTVKCSWLLPACRDGDGSQRLLGLPLPCQAARVWLPAGERSWCGACSPPLFFFLLFFLKFSFLTPSWWQN